MKTKPFDLERALAGDKVVIELYNGEKYELTNLIDTKDDHFPLLAIYKYRVSHRVSWFNYSGIQKISDCDYGITKLLMLAHEPVKKTYWVNIYQDHNDHPAPPYVLGRMFHTREHALANIESGGYGTGYNWISVASLEIEEWKD